MYTELYLLSSFSDVPPPKIEGMHGSATLIQSKSKI